MKIKSQIPNLLTLGNLFLGVLAIYFISRGMAATASILILGGAFLDFFDGLAARMLGMAGEMGKQLDSLADVVSFGVAPAFIAADLAGLFAGEQHPAVLSFLPLIIAPFAAYRLAKFNIDTRQSVDFIGLATPSNALFWLGFPLIIAYSDTGSRLGQIYLSFTSSPVALSAVAVLISILMVSEIRFFSLKFKSLRWEGNVYRYVLLGAALILLGFFQVQALPIILLLYLILSLIYHFTQKSNGIYS